MSETYYPDKLTPVTPAELYASIEKVWPTLIQDAAFSRAAALVLLAHWALETGFGHACHWYNLGNKKHAIGDGHDWTQFRCGEVENGREVFIDPPAPGCQFVAFQELDAGTVDYLVGLRGRYRTAWPSVLAGDVVGFCHYLKLAGYFTADEGVYTQGVQRCYRQLDATIPVEGAVGDVAAIDEAIGASINDRDTIPPPDPNA